MEKQSPLVPIVAALTYVLMVTINALANILPIAGMNTGAVSDSYPNLFAPAGLTFSIWGLIYLLLAIYTISQFFAKDLGPLRRRIGLIFSLSSVANSLWIFTWHYQYIGLSVVLMLVLLISLISINRLIVEQKQDTTFYWTVRLPFSVYFGWITVATIANVTTFLVGLGWSGAPFSQAFWTALVLVVGLIIGLAWGLPNKDRGYLFTLIWAFLGILIKHTSVFASAYLSVIVTVSLCLVVFALAVVLTFRAGKTT
jgi:hypothetical protein